MADQENHLHLKLKRGACYINTRSNGLSFLGARIFPALVRLKRENLKRTLLKMRRREIEFSEGRIGENEYIRSMAGLAGHLGAFGARNLMKSILRGNYR